MGLSPNTLTLGRKMTVTGSGSVDEAVTDGTFEMNIKASILSKTCTGNICQPSTCPLPAGEGSITWNGMKCPLAKGDVTVGTDVILSGALPPWAARATIGIKGNACSVALPLLALRCFPRALLLTFELRRGNESCGQSLCTASWFGSFWWPSRHGIVQCHR